MPKDNRTHEYRITMFDDEYEIAEKRRHSTGMSKAKYGRQALMTTTIVGRISSKKIEEIHADLNKIGSNLNQIARAYNAGKREFVKAENLRETLEKLHELIAEIYNTL